VTLRDRLARVADRSTLRLTHHGRRSGKPYEVTIWFMVEGEAVYLVTANRERQWGRNVTVNPTVGLRVDGETLSGRAEPVTAPAVVDHIADLMAAKYWYTRPFVWVVRTLGGTPASATFRVRVDPHPDS